jgi:hypothetical protein
LFAFIGLGLFQPAFWLLYRLPIDSESRLLEEFTFGSPFVIVVLGLALTSVSLAVMSVRKKAIKSKADSAEKHTENSTDTGE